MLPRPGFETTTSRTVVRHSTNWAHRAAVNWICQGSHLTIENTNTEWQYRLWRRLFCAYFLLFQFGELIYFTKQSFTPVKFSKQFIWKSKHKYSWKTELLNGVYVGYSCQWMHYGAIRMNKTQRWITWLIHCDTKVVANQRTVKKLYCFNKFRRSLLHTSPLKITVTEMKCQHLRQIFNRILHNFALI